MNTTVVLPAFLLGNAINSVVAFRSGQADQTAVISAVVLLVAGTLATEVPRIGKRWALGVCNTRIKANLRSDALRGVLAWPAAQLHTTSVGSVMARMVGDVDVVGVGVNELMVETWDTLLFSASFVVAMILLDPGLALLALIPVPVALLLSKVVGARIAARTIRAREANAALTSFVQEGLAGLRTLRTAGRSQAYSARVRILADQQASAELASTRLDSLLAPVYATVTSAGVVAILWVGGSRVGAGTLTIGALITFLTLFSRFTGRAFRIPQMVNRVQSAAAAHSRLAPLLAPPPSLEHEPRFSTWNPARLAGDDERLDRDPHLRSAGPASVDIENLSFTYPGGHSRALDEITLTIPAGSLVAVTGPTGAGKSALARLLAGLYPPDSGVIQIDQVPVTKWDSSVRTEIGYLPQSGLLFAGTIAQNVLLSDDAPVTADAARRFSAAIRTAQLELDLMTMGSGVETLIGEDGVRVSGGQRQRIALARALAAPSVWPRLLILDDPFSALDVDTELAIIQALRDVVGPTAPAENRTTIVMTSTRLAAFPAADTIVVLDGGRLISIGTHSELVRQGGLYERIFTAQQQGNKGGA